MYRIRFHGRGGQGMKTASRMLGSAFFHEGFQVQDAPRYGAERRGAPIFAFVRADRATIRERGPIDAPDLVVVADDGLMQVPAAGIRDGLDAHSLVLIHSRASADTWRARMGLPGEVLVLPAGDDVPAQDDRSLGPRCTGAAARLVGAVSRTALERGVRDELAPLGAHAVDHGLAHALHAYDALAPHAGRARPRDTPSPRRKPDWIDLPFDDADVSAPAIHAGATSTEVRTGLWRSVRPVIDHARCHRCAWMCAVPCPDAAIHVDGEGYPRVDLDHCKGCLICVAQCPFHVIEAVAEHTAARKELH
jgi:pyruvate ferredoxin oxidoreductase gamma subunit